MKLTRLMLLAISSACILIPLNSQAEEFVLEPLPRDNKVKPEIIGGAPADPTKFTSTLIFVGAQRCTATIVGQRSVLTAAHCVANTPRGTINLGGSAISLTCNVHPQYITASCTGNPMKMDCTADVALCYAGSIITAPGLRYERVQNPTVDPPLAVGSSIVLLGYGCLTAGGNPSNALYLGSANVRALSKGGVRWSGTGACHRLAASMAVAFGMLTSCVRRSRLSLTKASVKRPIHGRTWCNPAEVCARVP
jgi:Trypsin